ncbi:hypothetical protein HDU98_006369 [Podochytrium sp. JEL0797]|nr:hypothetical protein HDU98_006369 [Podochytrium sp. JEL0797]
MLLRIENLSIGTSRLNNASFEGKCDPMKPSILTVRGPSGSGKTTLLKALAQLIPYESGTVSLDAQTPVQMGIPKWRTKVMYVPQRSAIMEGTPLDFFEVVHSFAAHSKEGRERRDVGRSPVDIAKKWNVSEDLWRKQWNQLSGGESQRIALAIAVSMDPVLLLLDETCLLVEDTLRNHNCIWVTHDPDQEARVKDASLVFEMNPDGSYFVDIQ